MRAISAAVLLLAFAQVCSGQDWMWYRYPFQWVHPTQPAYAPKVYNPYASEYVKYHKPKSTRHTLASSDPDLKASMKLEEKVLDRTNPYMSEYNENQKRLKAGISGQDMTTHTTFTPTWIDHAGIAGDHNVFIREYLRNNQGLENFYANGQKLFKDAPNMYFSYPAQVQTQMLAYQQQIQQLLLANSQMKAAASTQSSAAPSATKPSTVTAAMTPAAPTAVTSVSAPVYAPVDVPASAASSTPATTTISSATAPTSLASTPSTPVANTETLKTTPVSLDVPVPVAVQAPVAVAGSTPAVTAVASTLTPVSSATSPSPPTLVPSGTSGTSGSIQPGGQLTRVPTMGSSRPLAPFPGASLGMSMKLRLRTLFRILDSLFSLGFTLVSPPWIYVWFAAYLMNESGRS